MNIILENNPSLLKRNDISNLNLESFLLIFVTQQIKEEELQICALEMLNLTLLRLDSSSDQFFINNWQFFQKICGIVQNLILNCQKNSLLFETGISFVGNMICKGIECDQLFNIESLFLECFESLKFQQRSKVVAQLVWLLKILIVYISSLLKSHEENTKSQFNIYFTLGNTFML